MQPEPLNGYVILKRKEKPLTEFEQSVGRKPKFTKNTGTLTAAWNGYKPGTEVVFKEGKEVVDDNIHYMIVNENNIEAIVEE